MDFVPLMTLKRKLNMSEVKVQTIKFNFKKKDNFSIVVMEPSDTFPKYAWKGGFMAFPQISIPIDESLSPVNVWYVYKLPTVDEFGQEFVRRLQSEAIYNEGISFREYFSSLMGGKLPDEIKFHLFWSKQEGALNSNHKIQETGRYMLKEIDGSYVLGKKLGTDALSNIMTYQRAYQRRRKTRRSRKWPKSRRKSGRSRRRRL